MPHRWLLPWLHRLLRHNLRSSELLQRNAKKFKHPNLRCHGVSDCGCESKIMRKILILIVEKNMDSILWNSKMSKEKGILNEWRKQMTMTHCTVAQIASDDFGTQSLGLLPIFQLTSIDRLEFCTDFHVFSMWSTLIMNIHKSFYHFYFKHLRTRALLLMLFILTSTAERVPTISKQFRPFEDSRLSKVTESEGRNSMRPWKTSHVRSFTQLQAISQGVSCFHEDLVSQRNRSKARLHQSKGLKVLPFKASMRQTKWIAAKCYQQDNYTLWSFQCQ